MIRSTTPTLIAAAAVLAPTGASVAFEPPPLTFEPHTFTSRSGVAVEVEVGTLTVAYDRDASDPETIDLKFVRFPATTDDPGPPMVYLAGGPGGSGIGAARGPRFELFTKLRELGDVIAWDQRGTGASEPRVRIEATVDVPFHGAVSPHWLREQYERAAGEARAQFERDGFDPAPLNTNASADDLEDLRLALGVPKLRLWSISYGTHLALATLKRHPDSIDAMVLAGVEGLDSTYKLPSQTEAPIAALSREVAAHPVLGEHIPDLAELMRSVLERAEKEPFPVEVVDPSTGKTGTTLYGRLDLEMVTWSALFRRNRMSGIPAAYLALSQGRTERIAEVVGRTRGAGGNANAMSIAMDCASGVSPERLARIDREEPGSLFGRSMNFRSRAICTALGIPDLGEAFRAPARSDIPVLCLSGEMDVRTPPSNAEAVLEGFPNGHHVVIERAGHDNDLWVSSPKIAECILALFRGEPIPYERIELPPIEFTVPPGLDGSSPGPGPG
jgi:pimeloyl-ACP methyl ester carboxylesterase